MVKRPLLVLTPDLSALSKLLERIVFDQIQCYFSVNKLITDFQHAYREGHSTCPALTQMTNDWLKFIYYNIVGAVLLDFRAAFDSIEKYCVMAFQPLPYHGFRDV